MLTKQAIDISFAKGINTKTDPWRLPAGQFLSLQNSIFTTEGQLRKRNGFGVLSTFVGASTLSTLSNNLLSLGNLSLQAYVAENNSFVNTGFLQPLSLSTQPLVRSATSQTTVDITVAPNGLACTTWLDSNSSCYYQISDSMTGQVVIPKTLLPSTAAMPRCFVLGNYIIITFLATVSAATHLQYIAIPLINPTNPGSATDIATTPSSLSAAYDGIVADGNLYLAWNKSSTIGLAYLTSSLIISSPISLSGNTATLLSLTTDTTNSTPIVWLTWYNSGGSIIKTAAYNYQLNATPLLAATTVVSSITINELVSTAANNNLNVFYEVANTYSYSPNAKTDYISFNTCTLAGTAGTPSIILRGVGLASKAIYVNNKNYMLACYGQAYQPTYFLIDGTGNILSKVAYSNGGGYAINQILPSINLAGTTTNPIFQIGYLYKDFLASIANPVGPAGSNSGVNKTQGASPVAGIYSQTGINLATFTFNNKVSTSEIANSLHIGAGITWRYDGVTPVEHQFHVWPEDITAVWSASGGSMQAQPDGSTNTNAYYYQVTYEWTDSNGFIDRSAPSVPIAVTTTGSGTSGSVTLNIPYARLTYKTSNKIRIVVYRWSVAHQEYYQVTSITSPTLNNPAADSVAYVDTQADSSIVGNNIIYTTGGVVEDIAPPATSVSALFDDRMWLVDAEDTNLLWFSKQVIESVPVEFSDLFTVYIAPSTGAQGSTGPITALFPMDSELIIFKKDALYYINGTGPDNTGSNNAYNGPIFITSTAGTSNPNSIVMTPAGLMFQSDKGIWLLPRNLSDPQYIGAPVEAYNSYTVTSAWAIPETTQVRFTLDSGICLMYDYFYQQWGTFTNLSAVSSCLYNNLHTYLNQYGQILQETPNLYLDGSSPVLMSFTTSWLNMMGLQGYMRSYFFYLIGQYLSPHKLQLAIAYDYNPSPSQVSMVTPTNFSPTSPSNFGSPTPFGGPSPYQYPSAVENWRVFLAKQRCQSFQITLNEIFDSTKGTQAGAGLTLSGLNLVIGAKKGYRPISNTHTVGGGQNSG